MKKYIAVVALVLGLGGIAFADVSTNAQGQIIDTYTNAMGEVSVTVIGYASSSVASEVQTVRAEGTYTVYPEVVNVWSLSGSAQTGTVYMAAPDQDNVDAFIYVPSTAANTNKLNISGASGYATLSGDSFTNGLTAGLLQLRSFGGRWTEVSRKTDL